MTNLALPTAWNARRPGEPAHLNSVRNLIPPRWMIQPRAARPPAMVGPGYAGVGWRSGLKYSAGKIVLLIVKILRYCFSDGEYFDSLILPYMV